MSATSHLMTMGTALGYAHDNGLQVGVLVHGIWIVGHVLVKDGHGVVLRGRVETIAIKLDQVQSVRFNNEEFLALEGGSS